MGAIRHNAIGLSSLHPAWISDGRVWGRRELARCNPLHCIARFLDDPQGALPGFIPGAWSRRGEGCWLHLCSFPSSGPSRHALATTPRPTCSCIHAAPIVSTRKLEPFSGKKALNWGSDACCTPKDVCRGTKGPHGSHWEAGFWSAGCESSHHRGGASPGGIRRDTPLNSGSPVEQLRGLPARLNLRSPPSDRLVSSRCGRAAHRSEANQSTFI